MHSPLWFQTRIQQSVSRLCKLDKWILFTAAFECLNKRWMSTTRDRCCFIYNSIGNYGSITSFTDYKKAWKCSGLAYKLNYTVFCASVIKPIPWCKSKKSTRVKFPVIRRKFSWFLAELWKFSVLECLLNHYYYFFL